MHVQDVVQENIERRDPSTTRGIAVTHFSVAQRQGVKHRDSVVQGHVFSLAQHGTSQYGKPPQGAGICSKPMDAYHPTSSIAPVSWPDNAGG